MELALGVVQDDETLDESGIALDQSLLNVTRDDDSDSDNRHHQHQQHQQQQQQQSSSSLDLEQSIDMLEDSAIDLTPIKPASGRATSSAAATQSTPNSTVSWSSCVLVGRLACPRAQQHLAERFVC